MNSYQKATQLGLVGTDQEIVDQLKALGITRSAIQLSYLMELLNFRGMLRKTDGSNGQERWIGTLQNLKGALISLGMTSSVANYEMWFSHVTNPRQVSWDTRLPEFAAGFWLMYSNFADAPNMPSSADFLAVASLGGGWVFSNLTAEQFGIDRDAIQLAATLSVVDGAWSQVDNEIINVALSDNSRTKQSIAAALREAADQLEA